MEQDRRGRLSAHGSKNPSPQPSPRLYNNGFLGMDQSGNANTFAASKYAVAHSFQDPFAGAQSQNTLTAHEIQQYQNNQFDAGAFPDTQFSDQGFEAAFNPSDYMINPGDNLATDLGQDMSYMNQNYSGINQQNDIGPADPSKMSSPDHASPGSVLLSPENRNSPGPPGASPGSTNGQFHTPQHSRHASLDPASAYEISNHNLNAHNNTTWQGNQFQHHRRMPSDQFSDVSSQGHHSPYLAQADLNEPLEPNRSPFLNAQDNSTYGMEAFNIGEEMAGHSAPGSTYVSPRLMPQQGLGLESNMLLGQELNTGSEMYGQSQSFAQMEHTRTRNLSTVSDMGRADQLAPPTINIEPAPVSRQASFGPQADLTTNTLSPPSNTSRGRNRSQSDVTFTRPMNSRSMSPSDRRESDSLSVRSNSPGASLSRESSPGVASGRITKDKDRRASTSSMHTRDYILDLADPGRPNASPSSGSTRVQKHPATFQCTLCPKRFTRAYNLRSHLRTHTDERPFVCTVCGKAFARQHDRKRHEGLHSGEKKFICRGELNSQPGQTWGCGRRFARADALGRHFRSEAGRVCIKPLLDEEATERRNRQLIEQQQQAHAVHAHQQQQFVQGGVGGGLQPVPPAMMIGMDPQTGSGGFSLPAALMAQYPQLANIDWNALSQQNMADDPGDLSDMGYDPRGNVDDGTLSDTGLSDGGGGVYSGGQW